MIVHEAMMPGHVHPALAQLGVTYEKLDSHGHHIVMVPVPTVVSRLWTPDAAPATIDQRLILTRRHIIAGLERHLGVWSWYAFEDQYHRTAVEEGPPEWVQIGPVPAYANAPLVQPPR
jgi:hypothetical protein